MAHRVALPPGLVAQRAGHEALARAGRRSTNRSTSCAPCACPEWPRHSRSNFIHLVFTLPAPAAEVAFHNKATVYSTLFRAASDQRPLPRPRTSARSRSPPVDSGGNRLWIPLQTGGGWRPGRRATDASEVLLANSNGRYRPLVFFVGAGDAEDQDDDATNSRSVAAALGNPADLERNRVPNCGGTARRFAAESPAGLECDAVPVCNGITCRFALEPPAGLQRNPVPNSPE